MAMPLVNMDPAANPPVFRKFLRCMRRIFWTWKIVKNKLLPERNSEPFLLKKSGNGISNYRKWCFTCMQFGVFRFTVHEWGYWVQLLESECPKVRKGNKKRCSGDLCFTRKGRSSYISGCWSLPRSLSQNHLKRLPHHSRCARENTGFAGLFGIWRHLHNPYYCIKNWDAYTSSSLRWSHSSP